MQFTFYTKEKSPTAFHGQSTHTRRRTNDHGRHPTLFQTEKADWSFASMVVLNVSNISWVLLRSP